MNHVQQTRPMTQTARHWTTESMSDYRDSTVVEELNTKEDKTDEGNTSKIWEIKGRERRWGKIKKEEEVYESGKENI